MGHIKWILMISSFLTLNILNQTQMKSLEKNKMKVNWSHEKDAIHFEMEAPTSGWVTIGFNTKKGTDGAYLLMGRVVEGKVEVVEHYTESPGNYSSFNKLGLDSNVFNISGTESKNKTAISFSVRRSGNSKYQKDLQEGNAYEWILAYSLHDDFQHHSIMRTSTNAAL